ncbi:EAL domain-containing protein [Notoacmeibacter sp. MSK16QG-6]|uniref:bifunctional diguanylate cyclase/phosphodiesterase n=1 Tax=Notoacmeibacter sp. MSK16QG-6 TaxID=2957982 RepID=UPI0020A17585|nr:EAL domain-containing protein [Notoacmeibacter sp. MSK16QG-6]MCP1199812.1 EAL domain-containing protein [Notoacmeibacter sp. MSK16QG-6]
MRFVQPGKIAALAAIFITLGIGFFADYQNRMVSRQQARTTVSEQLGVVRMRLEGNINSNIQLVRGLVAVIAATPNLDQARFAKIASRLIGKHSQLRNIGAAPDLVIRYIYPIKGNEQAIGLDYTENEEQRAAAMRAVQSGDMILAGPVDLVQGGRGFIGRFPVFVDGPNEADNFWGLVSAVVDVEALYADSGLFDPSLPIDLAIRGQDTNVDDDTVFFGDPSIFQSDPVTTNLSLPNGQWRIAAIPRDGWEQAFGDVWLFRLFIIAAILPLAALVAFAGHLYDERRAYVGELKRQQVELHRLSRRLGLALDTSRIGVWELDLDTMGLRWDGRMKELYGLPPNAPVDGPDVWRAALHPEDRERADQTFQLSIAVEAPYSDEFRLMLPNGETRWVRTMGAIHTEADGRRSILGVNWDVTADIQLKTRLLAAKKTAEAKNRELEEARAQMEYNSLHDSLTGLPNRRYLDDKVLSNRDLPVSVALLHVDLDRFKHINDTLGHAAGDAMLMHAASVLKANVGEHDIVARVGGDEFIIATTATIDEQHLSAMAGSIIEQMREPVPYRHQECRFGASIGIAAGICPSTESLERLLIDADIALYRAKKEGRNRYAFFSETLKAEAMQNKRVADDVLGSLERREFVPYFQPQFDAKTLDVVGVEALARWVHPQHGMLPPSAFLSVADELNVVPLIDRMILEQTLWHSTEWQAHDISIPRMSVNVSTGQLKSDRLIENLSDLVLPATKLSFELLESTFLDDDDAMIANNIEQLREMGIGIEIDDFGTGHASIVSLIQIHPSRLKIERRLVAPIPHSSSQRRLVASIIEIGHSLGIEVLAEGVETLEHAAILRDLGCDSLQGYALGMPMSSRKLIEFVREERWRKAA